MIGQKELLHVDSGIKYLSQWQNGNESFINWILKQGKVVLNKVVTGCGFTSGCLANDQDIILLSPRIHLIKNKLKQFNMKSDYNPYGIENCFYFDRKRKEGELFLALGDYFQKCQDQSFPHKMKLLVTYDSFHLLADMLESAPYSFDISRDFSIVVDESHCIIKDIKTKQYRNKNTMSRLLDRVFRYENVCFVSATPIVDYLQKVPQFQNNEVMQYELEWENIAPVLEKSYRCRGASDAFDQIFKEYKKNGYFDVIYNPDGTADYSDEAVIFINSVEDIQRILKKYITNDHLIDPADVSIICADTDENKATLKKAHPKLSLTEDVPLAGETHPTWTFCTRTCFAGVDFYSSCASTFVVANYNVSSLSLDIASDIPQIIGRQRLDTNRFRDRIHIFYTNNTKVINDAAFAEYIAEKEEKSQEQIRLYEAAVQGGCEATALNNLEKLINSNPDDFFVSTLNGYPEIDPLLVLDEQYSHDILKNHTQWFIVSGGSGGNNIYSLPVQQLMNLLPQVYGPEDRLRETCSLLRQYPQLQGEVNTMLWASGYNDIAYYINNLPVSRITALGYNSTRMDNEIQNMQKGPHIEAIITVKFQVGQKYSREEIKSALQEIYTDAGIKKTAKATDLLDYFDCSDCKLNGQRAYLLGRKNN